MKGNYIGVLKREIRLADFRGVGTDTQIFGFGSLISSRHK